MRWNKSASKDRSHIDLAHIHLKDALLNKLEREALPRFGRYLLS